MSRHVTRALAVVLCGASLPAAGAAAREGGDQARQRLERGAVIERVQCTGAPGQSYALYLPSSYSPDRAWPILYAFDPAAQGVRPVRLAAEPAERFGWIVAGSNNSRNGPMAEIQAAVAAILQDTGSRFPIDPRRVYATGFSGGARVAAGLAMSCGGCVAGVFAQGAGLPAGASPGAGGLGFAWFATAGERDMNHGELFLLEQELRKRDARQRLRVFQGGHEWAPQAVWVEALEWLELVAMNEGRRPRDAALVTSLSEKARARAADFEQRGELLDEQRELAALVRDFEGALDTAAARDRLKALVASPAYRKALDRERAAVDEQARVASDLQRDLAGLAQASDEHAEIVLRATRDASGLSRELARAREPSRRLVLERALAQVYIQAMEAGRDALRREQADSALELFGIAATLRPQAPPPHVARAQAQAVAGRKPEACRELRRALELGLTPAELAKLLESNDAFAKLRDDPDVRALLTAPDPP